MSDKLRVGVNGFGRIGRYFTRLCLERDDLEVVIVNDLASAETLVHLLKYDSIHGRLKEEVSISNNVLETASGKHIRFTQFKSPADIPWSDYGVDLVIESTGLFLTKESAGMHFAGGAKKVILSAPSEGEDILNIVMGVNDDRLTAEDTIVSNASCTTNSAAPLIAIMRQLTEIESAYITTIHSYTTDQRLHDSPHKDLRRARAAALSIVPTTTGAAKALSRIFPELEGHIGGCGMRVPVPDGSLTDLTLIARHPVSVEAINKAFLDAANGNLKGYLRYTSDPIVSIDIVGDPNSCIFDSELTSVVGNMIKVVGWYDNEAGYSNRLVDLALKMGNL